jgi:hypothetical protein
LCAFSGEFLYGELTDRYKVSASTFKKCETSLFPWIRAFLSFHRPEKRIALTASVVAMREAVIACFMLYG